MSDDETRRPINRAFATLHAAEEGDKVLFETSEGARKQPLTVHDVGGREGVGAGHYITLTGPRGGKPTLREVHTGNGWSLRYYYGEGEGLDRRWKPVRDIWFVEQKDPSQPREHALEASEEVAQMLAQESYDYDLPRAAHEVAQHRMERMGRHDMRELLEDFPMKDFEPPAGSNDPVEAAAQRRLEDMLVDIGQDFSDTDLGTRIQNMEDYDRLVKKTLSQARELVNDGDASTFSEASLKASHRTLNEHPTADHMNIIEMAPPPDRTLRDRFSDSLFRLVPWGDREGAYEQAVKRLQASVIEEHQRQVADEMKSDSGKLRTFVDTFIDAVSGFDADTTELKKEAKPDIPIMADGGAPHTTMDEANLLFDRAVPVVAGNWTLRDPGIVHNQETRHIMWGNEDTGEVLLLTGARVDGEAAGGQDLPSPTNEWAVWVLDTDGNVEKLYDGFDFMECLDVAKDYITPDGDSPSVELTHNGEEVVTMQSDVDFQKLGHRVVNGDGGRDFTKLLPDAGGKASTLLSAARTATTTAGGEFARDFWDQYEGRIGQLVLVLLVAGLLQGLTKAMKGIDSRIIAQFDALGIDVVYNRAGPATQRDANRDIIEDELDVGAPNWLISGDGVLRLRGEAEADESGFHVQGTVNPWPYISGGSALLLAREAPRIGRFLRSWGEVFYAEVTGGGDSDDSSSSSRSFDFSNSGGSTTTSSRRTSSREPWNRNVGGSRGSGSNAPLVSSEDEPDESDEDSLYNKIKNNVGETAWKALSEGTMDDPEEMLKSFGVDDPEGVIAESGTPSVEELEEAVGDGSRTEQLEMMLSEPGALSVVVDAEDLWPDWMAEEEREEVLDDLQDHATNEAAWGDPQVSLPKPLHHLDDRLVDALIREVTSEQEAEIAMTKKFEDGKFGNTDDLETWRTRKMKKQERKEAAAQQRREQEAPGQRWDFPTQPGEGGEVTTDLGGESVDDLVENVKENQRDEPLDPPADDPDEQWEHDRERLQESLGGMGYGDGDFEDY